MSMDYSQVEEQFKTLKEQFAAGTLDEAAFKKQLNELMVQDGQGRWWMIGYETGQWYMHDGSAWVRADPPGRAPAMPVDLPPEPVKMQAVPEPVVQAGALVEEAPLERPAVEKPISQPVEKQPGFIASRRRDALLVITGGVLFGFEGFFQASHVFMLFGLIPSLSGIFFGPWVGGLTGALGELVAFGVFSARGNGSYNPVIFILASALSGVISGLLVKDAKNWKSILVACLLARAPLFLGDFVGQVDNIAESYFADWFINRLVDFLLPGLLLVPLAARGLIDTVKERGWYWQDTPEPRRVMQWDWLTILLFSAAWSALWGLIYGLTYKLGDLSGLLYVIGGICGIASGLAGGFILRRAFPVIRAGQVLLIMAGWGISFLAVARPFANAVAYGYADFGTVPNLLFMGFAGGIGMGIAMKWAGIYPSWRQALFSSIVWAIGLTVLALLAGVLADQTFYRLFITGLLVGAVGAWGIFWQSQQSSVTKKNAPGALSGD